MLAARCCSPGLTLEPPAINPPQLGSCFPTDWRDAAGTQVIPMASAMAATTLRACVSSQQQACQSTCICWHL